MDEYHLPVLLEESIEGLNIQPGGTYVDVTYGGGGHSAKILEKLGDGKLIAFDQDIDAKDNLADDDRLIFIRHNFKYIRHFLRYYQIEKVTFTWEASARQFLGALVPVEHPEAIAA